MSVRGTRRRWATAAGVGTAIVAALAWTLLWSGGGFDARLERTSWVAALIGALALVVAALRWAWLWQASQRERALAGAEGFLGAAPTVGATVRPAA